MVAPVARAKRLEIYFDPGLRENVAVEDLVKRWARNGVRAVHAGAWHEYPQWTYEYDRLIELAHQNGMLVYAWLVMPLVSPAFWEQHPEWREKNFRGEEVKVDWRDAVSLVDPACRAAVKEWLSRLLDRFDFDGVNIAGLHFGCESLEEPETLSPFGDAARRDFTEKHGFDPRELFEETSPHYWRRAGSDLDRFMAWRAAWTTELHREFLGFLSEAQGDRSLSLTVTMPDAAVKKEECRLVGVDTAALMKLRNEYPFTVQLMDPGAARPWGEARVQSLLRDYGSVLSPEDLVLHLDVSIEAPGLPLGHLTGLPLYTVLASASPMRVAIYSEDSLAEADWPILARSLASYATTTIAPDGITVDSALGLRLAVAPQKELEPRLDGAAWRGAGAREILVPRGEHRITFGDRTWSPGEDPAIVDSSCEILDVKPVTRGLRFSYESKERAYVVLSQEAIDVTVDGKPAGRTRPAGLRGHPLLLPPGRHVVVATTESWSLYAFKIGSVLLSGGIVAISAVSLLLVGGLYLVGRLGSRGRRVAPVAPPGGGS
jgi:hypothetical protein